jgi:hypothetical protein
MSNLQEGYRVGTCYQDSERGDPAREKKRKRRIEEERNGFKRTFG